MDAEYVCLRKELFFRNHMFHKNDIYVGEPPVCGKGTDLTAGKKPCFRLISGPKDRPKKDPPEPKDNDPRSDNEIRDDIWTNYSEKVHPRMKRENLLAKEKLLRTMQGRDAAEEPVEIEDL